MDTLGVALTSASVGLGAYYRNKCSPAVRIKAVCESTETTLRLSKEGIQSITSLTPELREEVNIAKDKQAALFAVMLDANLMQAKIKQASLVEQYIIPNYSAVGHDGSKVTLVDLETKAQNSENDIRESTVRVESLKKGLPGSQNRPSAQSQSPQFSRTNNSFNVDLEANRGGITLGT